MTDFGIKMAYTSLREQVYAYVKKKYGSEPEYLWRNVPFYAVFRHQDNQKWYCIVMDVKRSRLGLEGDGYVDVVNVKLKDLLLKDILLRQDGFCHGYHGGGGQWVSILLDGTVPLEEICPLIDMSYEATASKQKRQELRPPKEWLIPVNQKYYDMLHAFDGSDILEAPKHIKGIKAGDTAYIYVSAPISAILYQCKVLEASELYNSQNERITITPHIKAQLLKRYPPDMFTFQILREEYGVYAIRGLRSVPNSLSHALNHQKGYDYD